MADLNYIDGEKRFNFRIAAYVTCKGKVLLAKHEDSTFYNMVGGRIQMGESSEDAIRREFKEELGIEDFNGKLMFVAENFFDWMDHYVQELLFIYRVELDDKYFDRLNHFKILDSKCEYTYWFDREELKDLVLRPELILRLGDMDDSVHHEINKKK